MKKNLVEIPIRITGETWYNAQEFRETIAKLSSGNHVLIDVNSEGPSLGIFGVYDILRHGNDNNYMFSRWSNPVEPGPYARVMCNSISHFFKLSKHYWIDNIKNAMAPYVFGLFVGRHSSARNYIMWDAYHRWGNKFLMSKMYSDNYNMWEDDLPSTILKKDPLDHWASGDTEQALRAWWNTNPIPSIDDKKVVDQYSHPELSAASCATSLLLHYDKFNFELVCESYTRGITFFPTEKTIRAIMGNKPFLVYGPSNFLKNLQNLGFKTFSGIWNEHYDAFEGPRRWSAMKPIIDMICNWDVTTTKNVLTQCDKITMHNRNRLQELINDC